MRIEFPIEKVRVSAFKFPTDQQPAESDGTLEWNATTMVTVEIESRGKTGIGYTYASRAAAALIDDLLRELLEGADALQTEQLYSAMTGKIRNNGRSGITAMAISAVDVALWDLKGRILEQPVHMLLGAARERAPIYGSGGFTSYSVEQLGAQLGAWVHESRIPRVKMKVGREPDADAERVAAARESIGDDAELFVDANGAYAVKQALAMAGHFARCAVSWYEEPVYHGDLRGNADVRDHAPPGMEVSNGEYGFCPQDFERMLSAGAADVLQADVTRCGGYTGFMAVDALCEAYSIPLSTHCAPYVTLPAACAAKTVRHVEFFYDHVLIEQRVFDGARPPQNGALAVDPRRPGIGLEFKKRDAERFAA